MPWSMHHMTPGETEIAHLVLVVLVDHVAGRDVGEETGATAERGERKRCAARGRRELSAKGHGVRHHSGSGGVQYSAEMLSWGITGACRTARGAARRGDSARGRLGVIRCHWIRLAEALDGEALGISTPPRFARYRYTASARRKGRCLIVLGAADQSQCGPGRSDLDAGVGLQQGGGLVEHGARVWGGWCWS